MPEALYYWGAFQDLSSSRQIGMGLGPIPFTAIALHADIYGITDVDEFDLFRSIILALDNEYLRINAPEEKPKAGDPAD